MKKAEQFTQQWTHVIDDDAIGRAVHDALCSATVALPWVTLERLTATVVLAGWLGVPLDAQELAGIDALNEWVPGPWREFFTKLHDNAARRWSPVGIDREQAGNLLTKLHKVD